MAKRKLNITISHEAYDKLTRIAGIASLSAMIEKLIKEAKE